MEPHITNSAGLNQKPNLNNILEAYKGLSENLIGTSDLIAMKRASLEVLRPAILRDRKRGVALTAICETVCKAAPELELTPTLVRQTISGWLKRGKNRD